MRFLLLGLVFCVGFASLATAQNPFLVNRGQTIFVSPGGNIHVQGNMLNEDSVFNNGHIFISDTLVNNAYLENNDTLAFSNGALLNNASLINQGATAFMDLSESRFENQGSFRNRNAAVVFHSLSEPSDTFTTDSMLVNESDALLNPHDLGHNGGFLDNNGARIETSASGIQLNGDSAFNRGTAVMQSTGADLMVGSTCLFRNATTADSVIALQGLVAQNGGQLINNGFVGVSNNLQANNDARITNQNWLEVNGAFDLNGNSDFINTDTALFAAASASNHAGDSVINSGYLRTDDNYTSTSTLVNQGTFQVAGDLTVTGPSGIIENQDSVIVGGDWGLFFGASYIPGTGVVSFTNATPASVDHPDNDFYALHLNGSGGITLNDSIALSNELNLEEGIVTTSNSTPLFLASGGSLSGGSSASHVHGPLIRQGNGDLDFPIGDSSFFRPVIAENLSGSPVLRFQVIDTAGAATAGSGLQSISNTRAWQRDLLSGTASGSLVRIGVVGTGTGGDGLSSLATGVVAQSATLDGTYRSIGNSATSGMVMAGNNQFDSTGSLTSALSPSRNFFRIGSAENSKIQVSAFLQGAYKGSPTEMDTLPRAILDTFELGAGGPTPKMLANYQVPVNAVDVVQVILRSAPTVSVDTSLAWLMSDGSLRDFQSGQRNYVTFANAAPGNYHIVLRHRNHLSAMSSAAVPVDRSIPASPQVDFTNVANVFGGGEVFLEPNLYGLVGGNAANGDQTVNANDFFQVSFANDQGVGFLDPVYDPRDVKLSGAVNAQDFNVTSSGNDFGFFATMPNP